MRSLAERGARDIGPMSRSFDPRHPAADPRPPANDPRYPARLDSGGRRMSSTRRSGRSEEGPDGHTARCRPLARRSLRWSIVTSCKGRWSSSHLSCAGSGFTRASRMLAEPLEVSEVKGWLRAAIDDPGSDDARFCGPRLLQAPHPARRRLSVRYEAAMTPRGRLGVQVARSGNVVSPRTGRCSRARRSDGQSAALGCAPFPACRTSSPRCSSRTCALPSSSRSVSIRGGEGRGRRGPNERSRTSREPWTSPEDSTVLRLPARRSGSRIAQCAPPVRPATCPATLERDVQPSVAGHQVPDGDRRERLRVVREGHAAGVR